VQGASPHRQLRPISEAHLHKQVSDFLAIALVSGWHTTFPADGSSRRGRIGLKRGVPDILIIEAGHAFWLELKTPRGRLSEAQALAHTALRLAGSGVATCQTLEEVMIALNVWGVSLRPGVRL